MILLISKAIHFIGFVAWFAGLFYLVRLYIYHVEALGKEQPDRSILSTQFSIMEKRLFTIIVRPAMIITFIGGIAMLIINPVYLEQGWMHFKLLLVIVLAGFSERSQRYIKKLEQGIAPMSSSRFRMINEFPTLLLVAIVLLAVLKNQMTLIELLLTMVVFTLVLGIFFYLYSKARQKKV
ncbi:MAG: protoporphyrinogen oxidase HemJ [Saprospiraceae bacterium]|nr:protoporphyrinogen oxidase HemJ [Saprospiraceae bacterium]